jgi:hypothetical protein
MARHPSTHFGTVTAREGALSAQELDELLREPIIASLARTNEEGYPYVVHVWTEWDGQAVWLLLRAKAAFVQHLRDRPKVALLVARSDAAQTRVLILGKATIVEGPAPLARGGRLHDVALRMAVHYKGDAGARYIDQSLDWPRCLVRIDPVKLIGWGDVDWHPRYR